MVTFLGNGLLERFSSFFVFLLVFIVIFGILEATKLFGKGKEGLNAWISLFIAILAILSEKVTAIIAFASPWFVVVFILLFFIIVGAKFFGGEGVNFAELIKNPNVYWVLIIIAVIIMVFSFIYANPPGAEEVDEDEEEGPALIDPKILGLIAVFLIAIFAIIQLTGKVVEK